MTSISLHKTHREFFTLLLLCGLILLTVGKDLLHSFIMNYRFYLSESMLFGMFWFLFVPLGLLKRKVLSRCTPVTSAWLPVLFSVLHVLLFSVLVFAISGLFFEHTFGMAPVFTETLADNGLAGLIIYGALAFIFPKAGKTGIAVRERAGKIRVKHRDRIIFLACEDIIYVKTERPYIALVTPDRSYLYHSTLKSFQADKLTHRFIRIHKSTVINTGHIRSCKSRKNGDYDVLMTNGDLLRVSRNYNAYFRSFSKNNG